MVDTIARIIDRTMGTMTHIPGGVGGIIIAILIIGRIDQMTGQIFLTL